MQQKKEYYEKLYQEQNKIIRKQTGMMFFKKDGPALKDLYAQKPVRVKEEMKREKKKKDKSNFGVAFLIVNSKEAADELISSFKDLKRDIKS